MKASLIAAALILVSASVVAGPLDKIKECQSVKDGKKRLACFDAALPIAIAVDEATREVEAKAASAERQRTATAADGAEARAALMAVKRLQTRVGTGISYRDYPQVLSEAKFAVESFVSSPAAKTNQAVAALLTAAMQDYDTASQVWRQKFWSGGVSNFVDDGPFQNRLLSEYPRVGAARDNIGLRIDNVLPILWRYAGERIAEAERVLAPDKRP